jgi:uncharacterized protein (UPF0335 family)
MSDIGHNGEHEALRGFINRIENLLERKDEISDDISSVYSEAKGAGFDPKIMRKIIAERKIDDAKRKELAEMLDLYRDALGMLADTPLGDAALRGAGK